MIVADDHADAKEFIDHGEWSVFQFAGHDSFAMHVRELLDLEGSLEAGGEVESTSHDEQRLFLVDLLGDGVNLVVELQNFTDEVWQIVESINDFLASLVHRDTIVRQSESKHEKREDLRCVGLGRGNSNFRSGVDVDSAVRLAADRRSDGVGDSDGEGSAWFAVSQSHQSVGGLSTLRDEQTDVVTEDWCLTIQEIRGELDDDGKLGQLLKDLATSDSRVVGGSASDHDETTATLDVRKIFLDASEDDLTGWEETPAHRIDDRLWLFENLLLHVRLVGSLKKKKFLDYVWT